MQYAQNLLDLMEEPKLVDIWRLRYSDSKRFTFQQKRPYVQSRLDYWLISENLQYHTIKTEIQPCPYSDHSLETLEVELPESQKRGRGFWKLLDEEYVRKCTKIIEHCKTKFFNYENKNVVWELIKCDVRHFSINYAIKKAKNRKEREDSIQTELIVLKYKLDEEYNIADNDRYQTLLKEQEILNNLYTKGAILRSKAKYVEMGERNTKYFFNLERKNQLRKNIRVLKTEDSEITDPNEILNMQKQFYSRLYEQNPESEEDSNYFFKK